MSWSFPLSRSDPTGHDVALFDDWVVQEFRRSQGFTALVVLIAIGDLSVMPLRSTFVHVIGDELDWAHVTALLAASGVAWDGVMFHPISHADGGPVDDAAARAELRQLERRVVENRLAFNEGHVFDKWGRRLKIEEAEVQ